jgi:hypothetical protein
MNIKYQPNDRLEYDLRFQAFLSKLVNVSNLHPKEIYLYPLMDKVIFKDFETAIGSTIIDFAEISNDNAK